MDSFILLEVPLKEYIVQLPIQSIVNYHNLLMCDQAGYPHHKGNLSIHLASISLPKEVAKTRYLYS